MAISAPTRAAAVDAAKALADAQAEKTKIDALFPEGDDNPVVDLVSELLKTDVSTNTTDIDGLDGRVTANETDLDNAWMDLYGTERGVEAQHDDLAACDAAGIANVANCANSRSIHNEADIADLGGDIEDLDGRVGDNEDAIAPTPKTS